MSQPGRTNGCRQAPGGRRPGRSRIQPGWIGTTLASSEGPSTVRKDSWAGHGPHLGKRTRAGAVARLVLLAWMSLLPVGFSQSDDAGASSEYEVKSAWLLNFVKFTEWPEKAWPAGNAPIQVGVVGADDFVPELEKTLRGKTAKSHGFVIHRMKRDQDLRGCQVLFVGRREHRHQRAILEQVEHSPILTIGDSEDFDDEGGIIGFRMKDDKVRFDVNLEAANSSSLKINPKLLNVAHSVKGKREPQQETKP
jgi:YfiR/HmsC-like